MSDHLFRKCTAAIDAAGLYTAAARDSLRQILVKDGKLDRAAVTQHQYACHGFAWLTTYVEALRQTLNWAIALDKQDKFSPVEELIVRIGFGEYLDQMRGGIAMSQGEIIRPADMGLPKAAIEAFYTPEVAHLIEQGNNANNRAALAEFLEHSLETGAFGQLGLDETYDMIREQFRRFAQEEVTPHAHDWHLQDAYIPMDIIDKMSEMGVFGLTIPEEYGGLGLGKTSMCIVSEELSRGYIGVGSLGTRSEIAAELILGGGTTAQKEQWLPRIAAGEILPTAVFTEPNVGSDLGALKTRAVKEENLYRITGNKTWITHAARADVMTLLARTNPDQPGYKGLSMFLAEKTRGTETEPFPDTGLTGGEIEVLGYRGMKEFELAFDGFTVKEENLLGGEPGRGFKQLMTTFESARIQTAARALGVAQSALELGLRYGLERIQFGQPLYKFPRVHSKVVLAAVEIMMTRQLTYFAARQKDEDKRCDLEAGMAKLLAARVAWSSADNALQIHGGNGYAQEYQISRVLCDARILNIFEGAAEIQADVIFRRLMTDDT